MPTTRRRCVGWAHLRRRAVLQLRSAPNEVEVDSRVQPATLDRHAVHRVPGGMEVSHGLHLLGRETRLSVRLAQCIEKCVELTLEHRVEVVRTESEERKSVEWGKGVTGRVASGGARVINKKKKKQNS